jgi:hypothetical protein
MWEQTRHRIARRRLLQGLGAATTLLSPFVRNRLADAATGGNFWAWFSPNGHVRSDFGGDGSGPNFTLRPSLSPLEPHKADVIVLRGIANKTSSTFNSHEDACKFLSMYFGGGDKLTVYGPSFDQELALALNAGKPLTLGVDPQSSNGDIYAALSWVAAGKSDPKIISPVAAYNAAFGAGIMPADNGATAALVLARRKSLLDFVRADIARFSGRLVGKDKENLDLYTTAIRDLENKLAGNPDASPSAGSCDSAAAQKAASDAAGVNGGIARFKAQGEALIDVTATAFACGNRRVATMCWQRGSGGINPVRAGGPDHHGVSHGEAPISEWKAIDKWYADRFAYTIQKLKSLNILGDTIVVWGSDISENHNQNDQVFVLAGGRNKGIKSGNNIRYPFFGNSEVFQNEAHNVAIDPRNVSQADLWVSVQKALGVNKDYVGDKNRCTGGLKEVFAG